MAILEKLRKHWGYSSFRPLQREAVEAALSGKDSLVILPTGGGKSLCYQLPASMERGLVVVISPLIALMDDQVAAAREAGLAADALHSNLDSSSRLGVFRNLAAGRTRLLYASPERLLSGDLFEDLPDGPFLFAVDEAHCVSHWGHEFRPEYRRLMEVLDRFPGAARMALTATATPAVQNDICAMLGLRSPARLVGYPDRPNLIYRAFPRREQLMQVLDVIQRHEGEGGIVYAQTRREVERIAQGLERAGVLCAPYHAGLGAEERRRAQDGFVNERIDVIVATIAFGMGIDRSNVRYVVHANTPRSVEHYQQESGRAGRDGLPAECVLLFSVSDLAMHRRLAMTESSVPPERQRALERQLREIGRYAVSPVCRHRLLAEHFGVAYPPEGSSGDDCGACDVCLGETQGLSPEDALLTAKKVLSAAWRTDGKFGTGYVASLLLGKIDERMLRNGHDKLRVCGLLKDAGEPAVRSWIDQLVVQNFLEVSEENNYPLLRITPEGRALCRDEGTVRLGIPAKQAFVRKKKARAVRSASGIAPDAELFENLRALRKLIAARIGEPPYVVFHDSTLADMAALKPGNAEALCDIKGMGEKKLIRYGTAFLKVIGGKSAEAAAEEDFVPPAGE